MNPVSEQIRKVRRKKNITLSELAEKTSTSQTTLSEIENGTRVFDYQRLLDIATALDVEVNELVPPFVDLGRCCKMPEYTKEELDELEKNYSEKESIFEVYDKKEILDKILNKYVDFYSDKLQLKSKKHNISNITIDTSELDISDIEKVNRYVDTLVSLKNYNYEGYHPLDSYARDFVGVLTQNSKITRTTKEKMIKEVIRMLENMFF